MNTGDPLETWGEEFARRVLSAIPETMQGADTHTCPSGLVVVRSTGKNNFHPLGCPICLGRKPQQNLLGNPTLGGMELLRAEDFSTLPDHFGPEVKANLWLCPGCKLPVISLLPKFDTLAYRP